MTSSRHFEPGLAEPALDQYGLPVKAQPHVHAPARLFAAFASVVTLVVAVVYVIFLKDGGHLMWLPVALARRQPGLRI
jgi:hypothetical protein